jgi:hypothetical protein
MPAPKTSNPPKRKGPAFKPPRPAANPAATTKRAGATASRPTGVTKKPAPSRPVFEPPALISSSEGEDEEDAFAESDFDELMNEASEVEPQAAIEQPQLTPIPPPLLARLLQEGFEDDKTRIQRGAMELTSKYLEIFVREAIARAQHERRDANKGGGGGISDGFLQVEDLEKLAPQLVLDF